MSVVLELFKSLDCVMIWLIILIMFCNNSTRIYFKFSCNDIIVTHYKFIKKFEYKGEPLYSFDYW